MDPRSIQLVGDELVVIWVDGHESYYAGGQLREQCPCAHCAGEADLFGRIALPPPRILTGRSHEIASVERVGNYGIQITFADGHSYGIWTHEKLRAFCACNLCHSATPAPGK